MRRALIALAGGCLALLGCGGGEDEPEAAASASAAQAGDELRIDVLATGLRVPWDVASLPDGRALVTERIGRIRLVICSGRLASRAVGRVSVAARGEGGMLGLAVDPDFAAGSPFVYVYWAGLRRRIFPLSEPRRWDSARRPASPVVTYRPCPRARRRSGPTRRWSCGRAARAP